MLVSIDYVNDTEGYRVGDSGTFEPWTEEIGKLFLSFQREYGRYVSKVYVDSDGSGKAIGWVFNKLVSYTDCDEKYMQSTWITLHNTKPTYRHEYDFHYLS